ncbi:hypothetical protein RintRC_4153 [Richelia intracellularis]|nr:hypothetical protein RintRC_4153 [Richelia intracellularis]
MSQSIVKGDFIGRDLGLRTLLYIQAIDRSHFYTYGAVTTRTTPLHLLAVFPRRYETIPRFGSIQRL